MNAARRTYYDVLGVSPETPSVVLKAAFRALAKEYHPDSSADAAADPDRFIELQDAYAVLSDPVSRSAYDNALREALPEDGHAVPEDTADIQVPAPATPETPALQSVHARFMLYSDELAAGFREAMRSGRSEEQLLAFADRMEDQFLMEYFGEDHNVRALAKILLLRCRKDAVLELNELIGASAGLPAAARRRAVSDFVERHFADDGLLSPWLHEKFSTIRAAQAVQLVDKPPRVPERRETRALPPRRPHRMANMVKVFCWSCAVYFGLTIVSAATN